MKGLRARGRRLLSSRSKHYLIMGLVALDVAALLLNVFIQLIACDMGQRKEPWVEEASRGLEIAGLVFSCLFMAELIASLLSFGPSFAVDIATRGFVAEIGSLIVTLRLWRLAKLSEEIVAGASERIDDLEQRNQELSDEIKDLKTQLELA
ncbi:hypothetical protein ACO1O0_002134 [Amphichorda felina]